MGRLSWQRALTLAIAREEEAAANYRRMQEIASDPATRQLLAELEGEEKKHKMKLTSLTDESFSSEDLAEPEDLGLTDELIPDPLTPELSLQDLLIRAAQKEKQAALFYASLASQTSSARLKRLFRFLEKQEKSHKLRLELEYERQFLPED